MGRELLQGLRGKKGVSQLWKKGQVNQEAFKDVLKSYRKRLTDTKVQLELHLANSGKENKKCFYKSINKKRKGRETSFLLFIYL